MNGIGPQKTIGVIRESIQKIGKIMSMNYNEFTPPNLQQAYSKTLYVIMKCKTEEQLDSAERYLRNYERLMQNSHLYPTIDRTYTYRTVHSLLSLLKIKRKDFKDF